MPDAGPAPTSPPTAASREVRIRSAQELQEARQARELEAILDKLDAQAALDPDRAQRQADRNTFRRRHIPVRISHPGGTVSACRVLTRDLSAGGLAFVHTGYVHVGTRVEFDLDRAGGGADAVAGTVARCAHIARTWHTVGVKFDSRIFPKQYLSDDAETPDAAEAPAAVAAGRVLHVDDDELERRLLAHHLRNTALQVVGVADVAAAVKELKKGGFDLVLTECRFESTASPGAEAAEAGPLVGGGRLFGKAVVEAIRAAGFKGPVALCTGETSEDVLRGSARWGIRGLLAKPYTAAGLVSGVGKWLAPPAAAAAQGPLVCTLDAGDPRRAKAGEYATNLHKLRPALEAATAAGHADRCRAICLTLRSSAARHGFVPVSDAAAQALTHLGDAPGVVAAVPSLARLAALCGRADTGALGRAA